MNSKKHLMIIQKKEPLGQYETTEITEMTWDEAAQKTSELLSPTIAPQFHRNSNKRPNWTMGKERLDLHPSMELK